MHKFKPEVIVNAVAYTAVDKAEEKEDLAGKINSVAAGVLAEEAKKQNALLVHYSTDYVFDGTKESPYNETDKPNPVNAYGRIKLAGEQAIKEKLVGVFSSDLYHLTTSGYTSWHGFTKEIVNIANSSLNLQLTIKELKAIPTTDYPTPAIWPMNSQLALTKLESIFTIKMPDWKKPLTICMAEI